MQDSIQENTSDTVEQAEDSVTVTFRAYSPSVKQGTGGGFSLALDIPETEWESIKELNNPALQKYEFSVALIGKRIN